MNKIINLIAVFSYSVVVSQSFMYILSLKTTQLALSAGSYTEVRQLIDACMNGTFKYVMYATLLSCLVLMIMNIKAPTGLAFITSAIAFVALVIDGMLTLKGNVPINAIINTWAPAHVPADWMDVRREWFKVFQYRQIANITGFISLLTGIVFGR